MTNSCELKNIKKDVLKTQWAFAEAVPVMEE